jgi:atypical dual specificity phosphatase
VVVNVSRDGPTTADESPDPLVRPKGFVADEAVVRRIGDRDCYLGNALAAAPDAHDHSFDFVLSATAEELPLTTHHRPLVDGRGNEWAAFAAAVDTARSLYRRDGSLLVNCKAGVSRSATLLATAIAAEESRAFREALAIVQDARLSAMPNPALHELAVVYLAART